MHQANGAGAMKTKMKSLLPSRSTVTEVNGDTKGSTLLAFSKSNITEGGTIHSDVFKPYNALSGDYYCDMQKYDTKSDDGRLKWPHVMISNIKTNIEGAYHGLEGTYLQCYLDEFCYRFNRRHSRNPLFDHLLVYCLWYFIRWWLSLVYNHYKYVSRSSIDSNNYLCSQYRRHKNCWVSNDLFFNIHGSFCRSI